MAMNFNDVLNTKVSEIERPPLLPVGTYIAKVMKVPGIETVGKDDEWDTCDFPMQIVSAGEDVNQEDLAAAGGINKGTVRTLRFMFDKKDEANFAKTLYRLKRFLLDHLKIPGDDDTSLKELLNNSINQQCYVFIKWNPDKQDKELMFDNIAKTAPLE